MTRWWFVEDTNSRTGLGIPVTREEVEVAIEAEAEALSLGRRSSTSRAVERTSIGFSPTRSLTLGARLSRRLHSTLLCQDALAARLVWQC